MFTMSAGVYIAPTFTAPLVITISFCNNKIALMPNPAAIGLI